VLILLPVDQDRHPTTWGEFSLDMELPTNPHQGRTPAFIASSIMIWPGVHRRRRHAISVHFNDVHLHTRGLAFALDVALIARLDLVRRRGVQIGVDTTLRSRSIHVELDEATI